MNWHTFNHLVGSNFSSGGRNHIWPLGMTKIKSYSGTTVVNNETMSCSWIEQCNHWFVMNRKCTRHDGGSIRKFRKGGEVKSPLPDLHHWPLALVLVILIRTLPLIRLPRPRTIFDKVVRTTTIETAIGAASLLKLLSVWPWAKLLRLLRRHWRSISSGLLRQPEN
jgi:hypothetical protein